MRTHVDLYSGIGGFSCAAAANGIHTVCFCEIDPFAREVLKSHWPDVPIVEDVNMVDTIASHCYAAGNMEESMKDYSAAVEMYAAGLSIQDVAEYHGVTRQAMWKILQRRGVEFRASKKYGKDNHFHRGEQVQSKRASHMVEIAVKNGTLTRQPCEVCGGTEDLRGHHDDYNKPLDVRWLCATHHYEWHKVHKPIALTTDLPRMSREEISRLGGKNSWKTRGKGGKTGDSPSVDLLTAGVPC